MKNLLECGKSYIDEMDIWDVGLLKCCLFALGMLIALTLPKKWRKTAAIGALVVFIVTYIPLMYKFFKIIFCKEEICEE